MDSSENPIPDMEPEIPSPQPASDPIKKFNKSFRIKFASGFIGWYIVFGLLWLAMLYDNEGYSVIFLFPLNLIVLITLVIIRKTRPIGYGILCALAVNLVITMIMGVFLQGACLVPFFIPGFD